MQTHKSTHLVNAFLLVHHPSAHRTKTAALPFSTLQWSQTQETLSYTAVLCWRAREEGREEGAGGEQERKEWEETEAEEERETEEGGERQSYSVLPLLSWYVICSSIFLICFVFLFFSPWLLPFIFLLMEGKEQIAAAKNLWPHKRRQTS